MIGIATLSKRIERLEIVPDPQPDIIGAVLSSLSDAQIDLLQEMSSLREAGFDSDTVAVFMADRHAKAMQAVEVFQERYATIQEHMKPKTRPKKPGQNGRGDPATFKSAEDAIEAALFDLNRFSRA